MTKSKNAVIEICVLSLLIAILVLQEEVLSFIPNVSFTMLLIVLYAKTFGFVRSSIILFFYVLLDSLIVGYMNPLFMAFQFIGWLLTPIMCCFLFNKLNKSWQLALIGALGALLYSWVMIVPSLILFQPPFVSYLLADLLFEGILCVSSFLTVLLLYLPIEKVLIQLKEKVQLV